MDWLALIGTLAGGLGLGGVLVALINSHSGKRKSKAETSDLLVSTALKTEAVMHDRYKDALARADRLGEDIDRLRSELEAANAELLSVRAELEAYRVYTQRLRVMLRDAGLEVPDIQV